MSEEQTLEVLPDAERVVEGLRDTGYEFNTAVADIIDNSIAANATVVDVSIKMDYAGAVRVAIADNGIGMDHDGLVNAMRYGSKRRDDPGSLGKFGLGLKTASTAFCRRLSVVSRASGDDALVRATWDLGRIASTNRWELLLSAPDQEGRDHLEKISPGASGTVVVWENVDRLLKSYQNPGGSPARKALDKQIQRLGEHIAMVYGRFLAPEDSRARNIEIRLNGSKIEPWDPFCVGVSDLVAEEVVPVEMDNGNTAAFRVRAFVLPRREEFESDDDAKRAKLSNDRQGLYIFREQRLIHEADWLGMFQKEPHGTLLRVEFSFDHRLDEAFHIDIKKSQILLNEDLWNWLNDEFLPAPRRAANERYRRGQRKKIADAASSSHDSSNANIASKEAGLGTAQVDVINPLTGEVRVKNANGQVRLKLKIGAAMKPSECYVQPTDGIDDGMLWEPALIDGHKAVRINTGHPYYHKVYVPNLASGVTVQGMDSLLWALCAAELGTVSEATLNHFSELRFEVSRLLRRLVEDLPEPEISDGAE